MADERLLHGIVEIEVVGEDAPRRIAEIAQRMKTEAQALGTINANSRIGQDLAQDLSKGTEATERFIRGLRELRTAEEAANGASTAGQERLRQLDLLIAKTEQLQRLQRIPPGNPVAAAETRAGIARDDARLRADVYGGGLAGMRASDQVTNANKGVTTAETTLANVQANLAKATEARVAATTNATAAERAVAEAERELAAAIARREANLAAQREYNSRSGYPAREVRPGAEVQLGVEAAERKVAQALDLQAATVNQQSVIDERIEALKRQRVTAEARVAAATERAALVAARADDQGRAAAAAEADRVRTAGDPRRLALMQPDSERFLQGQGIDITQSLRMQELAIEQQRLQTARQSLIARATALDPEEDLARLVAQREQVERRLLANTEAIERQRFTEGGRGGFMGGLVGRHDGSPGGVTGADIGFQAGQALKYYALYTAMSAVQQAISGLIRLSAEYADAVSDLAIATNQSTEAAAESAKTYSEIGARFATGPVEALQGASKFARTFRDQQTQQPLPGAGEAGAQIASYINILEGPERIEKVMQDLISVMRAYGQGPEGAASVYDQTQFISQRFGYQSGEVVGGAAALADLGKESGYTLPELTALIASVMQQTGTTSDAVAGDVKRILGSQDSPEMNQAFERFGVNLDLSFKDRLDALSAVIEKLPEDQRSKAITDLSADPRTGAVRAAILNAIPAAQAAVQGADAGSAGLVDRQVQQRLDNLSGTLKQLTANLTQTAVALGDVGIIDLLTHLIQILNSMASSVTVLANIVGKIPDPITEAAAALALLLATTKAIGATRAAFAGSAILSGLAGRGARTGVDDLVMKQQLAAAAGSTQLARSYQAQIVAATGATGAMARLTGAARGMAAGLVGAAGQIAAAAAIGGSLYVVGDAQQRGSSAEAAGNAAIAAGQSIDKGIASGDPEKIRAAQEALRKQRAELTKTNDGFLGVLTEWAFSKNLGFGDQSKDTLAAARNEMFKKIDEQLRKGEEAARQLEITTAQLNDLSTGQEFFGNNFQRVDYGIRQIKQQGIGAAGGTRALKALIEGPLDKVFSPVEGEMGAPDLVKIILDKIGRGTNPLQQQSEYGQLRQVVQQMASRFAGDPVQGDAVAALLEQANRAYLDSLIANTQAKIENLKAISGTSGGKTRTQINKLVTEALNAASAAGDVGATVQLLNLVDQKFLETYRKGLEAQRAILINQLEALRKAAATTSMVGVGAGIGAGVGAGNQLSTIDEQLRTLKEASTLTTFGGGAYQDPTKAGGQGPTAEQIAEARIAAQARPGDARSQAVTNLKLAKYQLAHADDQVEYYTALKALRDAQYELSQVALEEAKARINAGAKAGDNFSAATAALKVAQLDLKAARDKTSYYTALKALRDAQYDLAMLELEKANNLRLLRSDVTDPVAAARIAVQEASAKLAYDRKRGASSGTIVADQLALKQAQASAASSAWDQQFGDMQTNYDLNRISLSAYLKYLQSQKTYLEAVKNKTRDQVEQLNQVDRALQGLAEGLQGQWNLGDIRMPTAYEMRRAAAAGGGGTSTTYINVNGADTGAVLQMLQRYVGAATIQAAPATPVKV